MKIMALIECAGAGVGHHVADLAESLSDAGEAVHVIYNSDRTDAMFRRRLVSAAPRLAGLVGMRMHHSPHPHDALLAAELRLYALRNGPFEIIHCHSTKAGFIGRLGLAGAGGAIVYTPHAPLTMSPSLSRWARAAVRALEVGLSRHTDAIIAVSEHEARHLEHLGICRNKIFVVPNGVRAMEDRERLRLAARARLGVSAGRVVVGCVGRLEKQKRVDLVLRSVSTLPAEVRSEVQVAVVGGGSLAAELKSLASNLGIAERVVWVGEVEDATALMAGFDIFVLASDYEAMPYTLLEALTAGVPVVATRVGGVETAITDGRNGFTVERDDASQLCRCLGFLIGRGDLRSRMSRESLVVSRQFSVERMVERTLAVYTHVLSQTGAVQHAPALTPQR
jgi:glycosyltransferase involved in cell wall biosynthesis